jgi:glycosyltransferase involved in cell wall biosynthesis
MSPERPAIDILLPTFDGATFVGEQVESILGQSCTDWHLSVRDDGSTDGTLDVVRDLAAAHPGRITVTQRDTPSGSAKQNALEMLAASQATYVMLADQDDVWMDDKIALTSARMTALEAEHGADAPLLVHTDLMITDRYLQRVARSMSAAQQLDGAEHRLARLITQNMVTGCTVMINRPLADLVTEPFDDVVMHDWWLALIASAFGGIGFVDNPTVLYRQHGANVVGARPSRGLAYRLGRLLDADGVRASLADSFRQAEAFLDHFGDRLSPEQREMLGAFASIPDLSKVDRLRTLRRYGFWKTTLARRLGQVVFV